MSKFYFIPIIEDILCGYYGYYMTEIGSTKILKRKNDADGRHNISYNKLQNSLSDTQIKKGILKNISIDFEKFEKIYTEKDRLRKILSKKQT